MPASPAARYNHAMRWAEAVLLCVPAVMLAIWWFGPRHFSRRAIAAAFVALAAYAALLLYLAEGRAITGAYQPARLQNGQIIPGPQAPGPHESPPN